MFQVIGEALAFDVLHHQVRRARLVGPTIKKPGDVRMIEVGQDLPFIAEARDDQLRIHAAPDQFDGDVALIFAIVANRAVHDAHAAFADASGDAVRAEPQVPHGGRLAVPLRQIPCFPFAGEQAFECGGRIRVVFAMHPDEFPLVGRSKIGSV